MNDTTQLQTDHRVAYPLEIPNSMPNISPKFFPSTGPESFSSQLVFVILVWPIVIRLGRVLLQFVGAWVQKKSEPVGNNCDPLSTTGAKPKVVQSWQNRDPTRMTIRRSPKRATTSPTHWNPPIPCQTFHHKCSKVRDRNHFSLHHWPLLFLINCNTCGQDLLAVRRGVGAKKI